MVLQNHQGGLGLVEILATLAVIAVLSAMAAPAWTDWLLRRRVTGVSDELRTDLHYLRSEAVKRKVNMRISFLSTTGGACYVLHTGATSSCSCDESGISSCTSPAESIKTVFLPASRGVRIESNRPYLVFKAQQGTVSPTATIEVKDDSRRLTLRSTVGLMGRVKTCAVAGALSGYSAC